MSRFAGRSLDRIWFGFFAMHIPCTILMDMQAVYPPWLLAGTPLESFLQWYISFSRDPVMINGLAKNPEWDWIRPFFFMEGSFQLVCFAIGMYGFWYNDKRIYPLMLAYGASTATTMAPVLQALFNDKSVPPLTTFQFANLLGTYIPFLVIPLFIAIDMGLRINSMLAQLQARKAA